MRIWIKRLASLVAIYYFMRLLYLTFNISALTTVPWHDKLWGFIVGLRFDFAAIMTINAPLMIVHAFRNLPISIKARRTLDHVISALFVIGNVPFIAAGVVDSQLYTFTGRRMTLDYFAIAGDIKMQGLGLLLQYWPLTLTGLLMVAILTYWTWQHDHGVDSFNGVSRRRLGARLFFGVAIVFLMVRGGWQTKPLAPAHAYLYQPAAYSNLILNSAITLLRTPPSDPPQHYHDFASMEDIRKAITPGGGKNISRMPLAPGRNVVIFVVESLATEYVGAMNQGKGYTPFIDELITSSISFKNSFSNGRRSIDAMPAIFAGIPAWRDQPFVTSPYNGNDLLPLPKALKPLGYHSTFFHGGANGTMHFDVFSEMSGFDKYIGHDEYPGPKTDDDGQWGIFDEPFLLFAADTMTATQQPFLAGIFTLTSHNPFRIPDKYNGKFSKGTLPIHESIGYVDQSLRSFFEKARKLPWYNNTIFVITGDHTSLNDHPEYNNFFGQHRVPIIIFDPQGSLPTSEQNKIAQHVDIAPTIMDIVGFSAPKPGLFGWSLLDPSYNGHFVQSEYNQWVYFDQSGIIHFNDQNDFSFFKPDDFEMKHPVKTPSKEMSDGAKNLKGIRQYFCNGLLDNTWYR